MMKKLLTFMFILIVLAGVASAQTFNVVNTTPLNFSLDTSKALTVDFIINNTHTAPNTLNMNTQLTLVSGSEIKTSSVTYNIANPITIANNTEVSGRATTSQLNPLNFKPGTYTGSLNFSNNTELRKLDLKVHVPSMPNFALNNPAVSIIRGQSGKATLTIQNTGNEDLSAAITFSDLTAGASTIGKGNISVSSPVSVLVGQTQNAEITVNIPENQTAGTYTGTVTIRHGSFEKNATLTITVQNDVKQVTVSAATAEIKRTITTSNITTTRVNNTGNVALNVNVAATINGASVFVNPSPFVLQPGEARDVQLTVSGVTVGVGSYTGLINATYSGISTTAALNLVVKDPTSSVQIPSSVQLGSSSQERNTTVTSSFTLTNNGDFTLTNINLTSNAGSSFNVTFSPAKITSLSPGQQTTVQVSSLVPVSKSSRNEKVADIKVAGDSLSAVSFPLNMQAKNMLILRDVDICVDGNCDSVEDGQTGDEDAVPGSEIEIVIEIENLFDESDNGDIDIEDIELRVDVEDFDDDNGGDLDFDADFDLNAEDREEFSFKFTAPLDIDSGNHDVKIKLTGRDDNSAFHEQNAVVRIKVVKDSHDIRIMEATILPSTVSCSRSATLSVEASNLGSQDDDVVLTVNSTQLGIHYSEEFELQEADSRSSRRDKDETYSNSFPISVLSTQPAGAYRITVRTLYETSSRNTLSDVEDVILNIAECDGDEEEGGEEPPVVRPPTQQPPNQPPSTGSGVSFAQPAKGSSAYTTALIILTVVLSLGIVGMIFRLLMR